MHKNNMKSHVEAARNVTQQKLTEDTNRNTMTEHRHEDDEDGDGLKMKTKV